MTVHVFPNCLINFDFDENDGKKRFSHEAKASTSFIAMCRMSLWCPIMKKRRLLCAPIFVLNEGPT